MATLEVCLEMKAVLVLEAGTCRMLNGSDKDPPMVFVTLPDGGYEALAKVLRDCEGDDLTTQCKLLIQSIDAMLDEAYQSGLAAGQLMQVNDET